MKPKKTLWLVVSWGYLGIEHIKNMIKNMKDMFNVRVSDGVPKIEEELKKMSTQEPLVIVTSLGMLLETSYAPVDLKKKSMNYIEELKKRAPKETIIIVWTKHAGTENIGEEMLKVGASTVIDKLLPKSDETLLNYLKTIA